MLKPISADVDIVWWAHFDPISETFSHLDFEKVIVTVGVVNYGFDGIRKIPDSLKKFRHFYFHQHLIACCNFFCYAQVRKRARDFPKDLEIEDFWRLLGHLVSSTPMTFQSWKKQYRLYMLNSGYKEVWYWNYDRLEPKDGKGKNLSTLEEALEDGDLDEIQDILDEGADVNDFSDDSPLHYVVSSKSSDCKEIVQLLIDHGLEFNIDTFRDAIKSKNEEIVAMLVENGADVNMEYYFDWTPLFYALSHGNRAIVELLIDHGAKIDVKDCYGRTPMEVAAIYGSMRSFAKMCDKLSLDDHDEEEIGNILYLKLFGMVNYSSEDWYHIRKELEDLDPNERSVLVTRTISFGGDLYSPLTWACHNGDQEVLEFFIKICNPNLEVEGQYRFGFEFGRCYIKTTPIGIAANNGKLKILETLVKYGAEIDALSDTLCTPVFIACLKNNFEIVRILVKYGANLEIPNLDGLTCLMVSIKNVKMCKFLLQSGALVDVQDRKMNTALHYSILEKQFETTRLLLDYGADPSLEIQNGKKVFAKLARILQQLKSEDDEDTFKSLEDNFRDM